MKPEIFMDDFERTQWGDSIYSVVGRALTLATHFESSCRGLAAILELKTKPSELLESPAGMKELSDKLYRRSLSKHISSFAPSQAEFRRVLDRGRLARNEIAHEITLGMEDQDGLNRNEGFFTERIRELSLTLAEADRAVCFALTVETHDHLPTNDFLKKYLETVAKWVCELGVVRRLTDGSSRGVMSEIPVARNERTSYENFVAECPWCGKESIFNRASDLGTFKPIDGRDVSCQSVDCGKPFRIVGDSVNCPHEMLVFDCYELLERKHYRNCILSLAQAYEVFFSLFFRVELLYKPFGADLDQELADLKRLSKELHERIKKYTFTRMRALFLQHVVTGHSPKSLAEAIDVVGAFPKRPGDPKDAVIEGLGDAKLVPLLKALKATTIHTLRNRVVHKRAYRPTREEVAAALEESRSLLFPLTSHFDLHDEINWYMRGP